MPSSIPSTAPQNTVIVTIIFDMTDHHDKDGNVTHPAQLLDVTPERNTNTFANMTK
ncbi:hypothetical protein [Corynebacterium diphtheriae]|uniref:hypothetical protein n=1 Tax=Corynebacterium diphtheriae TaxID=1717 RepID=UPI0013E0BFE3|nr:hypothetical protein [Corynebacterium diphtheriae]